MNIISKQKYLPHNQLGQTDIFVSPIGLGTVKFGRNTEVKYPKSFELPSDKEISNLLSLAQNYNLNLIDTAPAYGSSEDRLGKLLTNRNNWIICSKVGEEFNNNISSFNFTKKYIIKSVEQTLKKLKTDYIDILLIHSDGNDLEIINKYSPFETLETLKQKGHIRSYGMSSKTIEGGIETLKHSDLAMVTYNLNETDQEPVLNKASELNKGILIKKAFASGHMDPLKSLKHVFSQNSVSSAIIGTINPVHLENNINLFLKYL